MSLVDLLKGSKNVSHGLRNMTSVSVEQQWFTPEDNFNVENFIETLHSFNELTEHLRQVPRRSLYNSFKIPKRSGGLRPIDAPNPELKTALSTLKMLIEGQIGAFYHHPCAFAYVKERSCVDLVKVHQQCESRWFLHTDFSNFFGSTTPEFVADMCSRIYPLNKVMENPEGKAEFLKAMDLCFLNGGLPQGTPMSPFLTNIMMIPIDHALLDFCGHHTPHLIYTRYADDIQISSQYDFSYKAVEREINRILEVFNAPFVIKPEKTHYGSRAGANWILGCMLNKDNDITIGWRTKQQLKAMLTNFIMSVKNGEPWDLGDMYSLQGKIAHYRQIEKGNINELIRNIDRKYNTNVEEMIKAQIKAA